MTHLETLKERLRRVPAQSETAQALAREIARLEDAGFEAWLERVDAAVQRRCGLSYMDLMDQPYREWFEDGVPPSRAAARAIRAEGGDEQVPPRI